MIKNIIFDIGGVMFDESSKYVKCLGDNYEEIYKRAYGKGFRECVLGNIEVSNYIDSFKDDKDYNKFKWVLDKENLPITYPLIKENYEYIIKLKDKGYNLFILSNISRDSFEYVTNIIDVDKYFMGGVYSFKEHIVKPDKKIFELIVDRYNLNKEETIFFDDKQRNVDSANEYGIKSYLFRSIDDIKNNL